MKCRSMYSTDGPPSMVFTTWLSQILSNNVFPILQCHLARGPGSIYLYLFSVCLCHGVEVFIRHFFFLISHGEEFFVEHIDRVAVEFEAEFLEPVG